MGASLLDTYDEIAHAAALEDRLAAARVALEGRDDRVDEREWLEAARRRLEAARLANGEVLVHVLKLPEFRGMRTEMTRGLQGEAVDAVDGLLAALTALNERSPLIEAIFRNLKPIAMRRAKNEDFEGFATEVEKRLASGYVARMLADESYAAIAPNVDKLRAAFAAWREALLPLPLDEAEDRQLRDELHEASLRVAMPVKQALLLAEAALAAEPTVREQSGIFEKRRRTRAA